MVGPGLSDRQETGRGGSASKTLGLAAAARIGLLLILGATYAVYAPATRFPFVYDDVFQIVQNPHLDSWRFLPVYFTQHVWSHIAQLPANFYRPLFLVWFRLNNLAFGHESMGWHFTTILLHLGMMVLVYVLARTLLRSRAAALVSTLVFGLHAVHVEAVAWVSGTPEPLSGLFFLGAFLCYLRWRTGLLRSASWLAGSLALFSAALLSKETAAVLPLVIAAYELTLGRDRTVEYREATFHLWRHFRPLVPYFALLGVYLLARQLVLGRFTNRMTSVPLDSSLLTWPWLLCFYLRKLIWPSGLSPLYDANYVNSFLQPGFVIPLVALCGLGAAVWWLTRRIKSGLPVFLLAWFLLTLAPALAIFCLASPAEGFHDRYLYLPSVAFALSVGAIFGAAWANSKATGKTLAMAVTALVCGALALSTHRQINYWSSNYVLFQRAVSVAPHNEIANLNFAAELLKTREYQRALQLSQRVIELDPGSARAMTSAASAAFLLGNFHQAEGYYAAAVRIDPSQGTLFRLLGLTRLRLGFYLEAKNALRQALAINPQLRGVHYDLGIAESHLGNWQAAKDQFQAELQDDPTNKSVQDALRSADIQIRHNPAQPPVSGMAPPAAAETR